MDPITRKEMFLAKAGGQSVKTPEPITREEMFLQRIAENGGGSGGGGGSASIDVTASPGQIIVVEEVDANGKPTKWKAAEYQPRTHWTEETVILPEATADYAEEYDEFHIPFVELVGGAQYTIVYNGVEYISDCIDAREDGVGEIVLGNTPLLDETGDNGIPFVVAMVTDGTDGMGVVIPMDDSTSVTLSIKQVEHTPIPVQYLSNAFPYYIEVTGSGTTDDPYACADTVAEITAIYNSGRIIMARVTDGADRHQYNLITATITTAGMGFGFTTPMFGSYVHRVLQFMPQADGVFAITVQEVK